MKNSELDQILKSAPVPDRPGAYWDQFPRRVMAKTDRLRTRADAETNQPPDDLRPGIERTPLPGQFGDDSSARHDPLEIPGNLARPNGD